MKSEHQVVLRVCLRPRQKNCFNLKVTDGKALTNELTNEVTNEVDRSLPTAHV